MVEDPSCVYVDAPDFSSFRELLGLNHREEVVLGLETSSGCLDDGDSEILNGLVEGRWYHIKVSQYGITP